MQLITMGSLIIVRCVVTAIVIILICVIGGALERKQTCIGDAVGGFLKMFRSLKIDISAFAKKDV